MSADVGRAARKAASGLPITDAGTAHLRRGVAVDTAPDRGHGASRFSTRNCEANNQPATSAAGRVAERTMSITLRFRLKTETAPAVGTEIRLRCFVYTARTRGTIAALHACLKW